MSEAAPLAQYAFRRSVFEKTRSYWLYDDRLVIDGADIRPQTYALSDLRKVQLKYEHTKQREYYQCILDLADRKITLRHLDYVSVGSFEDRRETYTPFVQALLARIAHYPNVKLQAGSRANFIGAIVGAPLMITLGVIALYFGRIGSALLAGFMTTLCAIMIGPSRPRVLDPAAPPQDLLPR